MTLPFLRYFEDKTPRDGPGQMALDEALLESADQPILRIYRWSAHWVSFGYSQRRGEVAGRFPATPLVRRWTGGGIVDHATDRTFSLIVPREDAFARLRPAASYCAIHRAVGEALSATGHPTVLAAPSGAAAIPGECFVSAPAEYDVLDAGGRKICGGAQRRTRAGLLHQGSLQGVEAAGGFARTLAETLASRLVPFAASSALEERAETLARDKYAADAWTFRLP